MIRWNGALTAERILTQSALLCRLEMRPTQTQYVAFVGRRLLPVLQGHADVGNPRWLPGGRRRVFEHFF